MFVPIKGYEGLYEISTEGVVISLGNFPKLRNKVVGPLKPGLSKGYLVVTLTDKQGVRKGHLVHRLVASTFIPNELGLRCVNHKNEIKTDNHVENLEWCSDQYNKEYSIKTSTRLKSPEGVIHEIKNVSRFCRENNLLQGNISKLLVGQRSKHRGWTLP